MSDIPRLLSSPVVVKLGLVLVHFLWQGTILGLVAAAGLFALRRTQPSVRYLFLLALLVLMLAAPVSTFCLLPRPPQPVLADLAAPHSVSLTPTATTITPAAPAVQPAVLSRPEFRERLAAARAWAADRVAWLAAFWALGVCLLSLRLLAGWAGLALARRRGVRPLGGEWQQMLDRLAQRLRVTRPALLLESARVRAPMLIGWLRPAVLLPAGLLTGLTPAQIEAIIAHELAHLRRCDFLVNLVQAAAETLLFYHPAVWWLSRRLRWERECCCDDLAVAACGDAVTYARALTALEQLRSRDPLLAPTASGGVLSARIRRLAGLPAPRCHRRAPWPAAAVALAAVAALALSLQLSGAASPAPTAPDEQPIRISLADSLSAYSAPQGPLACPAVPTPPTLETPTTPVAQYGQAPAQQAHPLSAGQSPRPLAAASPEPTAEESGELVFATIPLTWYRAGYILKFLGGQPMAGPPPGGLSIQPAPATPPSARGGGRGGGRGSLGPFLPGGIKLFSAASADSMQLLVAGTPAAVAELTEFVKLLDRKPQQVIFEVWIYPGAPDASEQFSITAQGIEAQVLYPPKGETRFRFSKLPSGVEPHRDRIATSNLLPVLDTIPGFNGFPTVLFWSNPRVNGDGTITMTSWIGPVTGDAKAGIVTSEMPGLMSTVNVRDGEPFAFLLPRSGATITIVVRARVVKEEHKPLPTTP